MESENKFGSLWTKQNELLKIIIVAGGAVFLTLLFHKPTITIYTLSKYQNPDTGKFVSPKPCTVESGPNQCRTFKEEFKTQEIITSIVSRKSGSTTCCITTNTTTLGGEVQPGSESCWTTSLDLPSCPSGYTMQP